MSSRTELGSLHGWRAVADGLRDDEATTVDTGPSRSHTLQQAYDLALDVMPKIGITRVGQICQLNKSAMCVVQVSRPHLFGHATAGQNSGAQGKGASLEEAVVSAAMECLESYCAEPRSVELVRGSYEYLRAHRAIVDPRRYVSHTVREAVGPSEAIMWTEAYAFGLECPVLVPAECVFFPFAPDDYGTRALFSSSSSGLGAGLSHLEAVLQGIYEVIERHVWASWEAGLVTATPLDAVTVGERVVRLLRLSPAGVGELPVICALIRDHDDTEVFGGFACHSDETVAVRRAIGEAVQSYATDSSGAREDLRHGAPMASDRGFLVDETPALPASEPPSIALLGDELSHLVSWLKRNGFPTLLVANLTRVSLDVPVVRVLIPGMRPLNRGAADGQQNAAECRKASYQC